MQDPSTGEMSDPADFAKKGESPEMTATRKGQILWRVGEVFSLGKTRVKIVEIMQKEKRLVVTLINNDDAPVTGNIYSARGMDWSVISRDSKTMQFVIEWWGKTKGISAMWDRLANNSQGGRQ